MPLFVVECDDITQLTDGQIDLLRCGDYLVKRTGKQRHAYKVSYKEDKQGMCLTYTDASTVETVSYDFTDGHWVYNSTDKADLPINVAGASFKPIYCHPITIDDELEADYRCHVSLLIFDNSTTEYNTIAKLTAKLNEIFALNANAVFPITGAFYVISGTAIHIAVRIDNYEDAPALRAVRPDGTMSYFRFSSFPNATIYDGVNKIN